MTTPSSPIRPSPSADDVMAALPPGALWEDPAFPAEGGSLFPDRDPTGSNQTVWLRPKDFRPNAKFISDKATRFDLDQGQLGNCWFIAAVATLAGKRELLEKVVPPSQNFDTDYKGLFRFRFWVYGDWQEVIIDDRLPVYLPWGRRERATLYFCHNKEDPDEFWPALLEKAYAKLQGSYGSLVGGKIQDALVDLTGGVGEVIDMTHKSNVPRHFFRFLSELEVRDTLMGCSITTYGGNEVRINQGLRTNHAYCISGLAKLKLLDGSRTKLVRLLNPWGRGDSEWTGRWSDGSEEWNNVTDADKKKLKYKNCGDGEFWIEFDLWRKLFTELQLCHIPRDTIDREVEFPWLVESIHGEWSCGNSCHGDDCCQYKVGVEDRCANGYHTNDHDVTEGTTLVVSLMQKIHGTRPHPIAYKLCKVEEGSAHLMPIPPDTMQRVGEGKSRYREVSHTHKVAPGTYSLEVTSQHGGQYFLRLVTDRKVTLIQ